MKRLFATEARSKFFDLLDRAARGETVLIEREGTLLRLTRGEAVKKRKSGSATDYRRYLHSGVDQADHWSWDWQPGRGLRPKAKSG